MKSAADIRATLLRWLPFIIVTAFGLWLLWPAPLGVMPLSADHTVHLTRAFLYGEQLAGGHLVGWSPTWFFGFPLGELYPVLGDLGVFLLRTLSFHQLDWSQAYALLFTLVFLAQGWALLRCGRAIGWGPVPGLIAALLMLADVGAYREGGWIYTVTYGVWPQTLATTLAWLAFAELALAIRSAPSDRPGRPLARAALAAAGALLAHPMALMMLAFGAPLYLFTVGLRGTSLPGRRDMFAATARHLTIGLGLGLALAAWWLLPMAAHRGWMASYGWLHAPLADMLRWASHGQWSQQMPAAVGHCVSLGLLAAAVAGRGPLRFFALWTVLHWLLASTDVVWGLRLDWLSAGFSHIQYQRFIIAAKPGLFLLAGVAVGGLVHLSVATWRRGQASRRALATILALFALALATWQTLGVRTAVQRHHVGELQFDRMPGEPGFAADYAALLAWARDQWDARTTDWRMAVRADRNAHWFMDAPVTTRTPTYKLGFTPGDNFVHKPESGDLTLLRRLGARYLVGTGAVGPPGSDRVAHFGRIQVFELAARDELAHLEPAHGSVVVEHADLTAGLVRVRVDDVAAESRLVFHIAGYPRWDLSLQPADGGPAEPVEWFEVPVLGHGPTASQDDRRSGRLRGGKALGDDGREPTLLATSARPGVYELRYARWRRADALGLALSLVALAALVALVRTRGDPLARVHAPLRRLSHPAIVGAALVLVLAVLIARHRSGAAREHALASARVQRGDVAATRVSAGPLKTDMLIFPAVLAQPGRAGAAQATFSAVTLADALAGWYALDDDDAKQRRRGSHRLHIAASPAGAATWTTLLDVQVPHRPDRHHLETIPIPWDLQARPVDLAVTVTTTGEQPPRLGFDLELR